MAKTITALSNRLHNESSTSLSRSMPFPDRWDAFFTPVMTLNDVYAYAYPTTHFDCHALKLTLQRPDER